MESIEQNVGHVLAEIAGGNAFNEEVVLVAATKTRTPEEIRRAIRAGVPCVGENKVQEFRDKLPCFEGAERHFIGNLQTNKVKYLIGNCELIHSVGSLRLAGEIARQAEGRGIVQRVLLEVNLGEENKGGFPYEEAEAAFSAVRGRGGIEVLGYMAMLPESGDLALLSSLCRRMRTLFERTRDRAAGVRYLSMGMSGDYRLCLEHGSNVIRLGSCLFGPRPL